MSKPGLSVIIVSWNTKDITDQCLKHMKQAVAYAKPYIDVEVIVAENASDDGSPEMIEEKYPWVKLYRTGDDLGYGKGNNYGFKKSNPKYQYVLLLNNDAYVQKETLKQAMDFMMAHPKCDVLGCRLQFLDGRFQPSAGYLPTPWGVASWMGGFDKIPGINHITTPVHPQNPDFFKENREVGWVMGACVFLKREVFEKTGGFDEEFFMYMEEVEWCHRVKELGFSIWYTPQFTVTHIDKASSMGDPAKLAKVFRMEIRGLVYFLNKHYASSMWWVRLVIKSGIIARLLAFYIKGNKIRIDAYTQLLKEI